MGKGQQRRPKEDMNRPGGPLGRDAYFLAKQWLMKISINPWRILSREKKRRTGRHE